MGVSAATLFVDIGASLKPLDDALGDMQKAFDSAGKNLRSVGQSLSTYVTAPIVIATGVAVKFSVDFNESMANVASLIPGNIERVEELKRAVQDLALETGLSTKDIADGLYQVISAFGDTADTVKVLEINARAATAGLSTTKEAIDLTSAVTKAYGDTSATAVERVADLAQQTVRLGQTTFPELAASIGRVTPLAKELGVSQEELFGVMATGTGVTGTASEVGTQLRGVFQSLMNPTEDLTKLLDSMGIESGKALIEQKGLQGAIDIVVEAARKSGLPLQSYIGSIEGQTLALALAGPQAQTFTDKLAGMADASGAMERAFVEQADGVNSFGQTLKELGQVGAVIFQALGDLFGEVFGDILTPLMEKIKGGVMAFRDSLDSMSPVMKGFVVVVVGAVAAIGPLLAGFGILLGFIPMIEAGMVALGITMKGVLITSGIGIAIAGVIAGIVLLVTHWEEVVAWLDTHIPGAIDAAKAAWDGLKTGLMAIWNTLKDSAGEVWGAIKENIGVAIEAAVQTVKIVMNNLREFWDEWGSTIMAVVEGTWRQIVNVVTTAISLVSGIVTTVLAAVRGDWRGVWEGFVGIIDTAWDFIKLSVLNGVDIVLAALQKLLGWIPGMDEKLQSARDKISAIIDAEKVKESGDKLTAELDKAAGAYESTATTAAAAARKSAEAFETEAPRIPAAVKSAADNTDVEIDRIPAKMKKAAEDMAANMKTMGLDPVVSDFQKRIKDDPDGVLGTLRTIPDTLDGEIKADIEKSTVGESLSGLFGTAIGTVSNAFRDLGDFITGGEGFFGRVKNIFTGEGGISGIISNLGGALKGEGGEGGGGLMGAFKNLMSGATGSGGIGGIISSFTGPGGLVSAISGPGGIGNVLKGVLSASGPWGMAISGGLELMKTLGIDVGAIASSIGKAFSAVGNAIKDVIGGIWSGIKGLLGFGSSKGTSGTETTFTADELAEMERKRKEKAAAEAAEAARLSAERKATATSMLRSAGVNVESGLSNIRSVLQNPSSLNSLTWTLQRLGAGYSAARGITQFVGGLISEGVTSLAQGGIVHPSAGGSVVRVAEAGEAEIVSPLSKLPELFRSLAMPQLNMSTPQMAAGSRNVEQTIIFQVNERELTRMVIHNMPEIVQVHGRIV